MITIFVGIKDRGLRGEGFYDQQCERTITVEVETRKGPRQKRRSRGKKKGFRKEGMGTEVKSRFFNERGPSVRTDRFQVSTRKNVIPCEWVHNGKREMNRPKDI